MARTKSETLTVRMTPEMYDRVHHAASLLGKWTSEWVRELLENGAAHVEHQAEMLEREKQAQDDAISRGFRQAARFLDIAFGPDGEVA